MGVQGISKAIPNNGHLRWAAKVGRCLSLSHAISCSFKLAETAP